MFSTGKVFKSGDTIKRHCVARNSKVGFNRNCCKYFKPVKFFQCTKWGERITIPECINRKFNYSQLNKYLYCKKCRQFDREIADILKVYIIDGAKVKKFDSENSLRKLPRRNKSNPAKRELKRRPKKRNLKRRKSTTNKRILRRRK